MKKYQAKWSGDVCEAVQWDGTMGHAKGINYYLTKNGPFTFALGPENKMLLGSSFTDLKIPVSDGDWIAVYNCTLADVFSPEFFSEIFEQVKEPSNG